MLKTIAKVVVASIGIGASVLVLHRDCERAWNWINNSSSDNEDELIHMSLNEETVDET